VRVTLIHNPGAGGEENDAKAVMKLLRRAGHKPRYQSSKDKGWDRVLDKKAAAQNATAEAREHLDRFVTPGR